MKFTALIGGERLEIALHRMGPHTIEAEVGSRKYTLEFCAVEPGVFWLNWNNRSLELAVTRDGDGYIVSIDGRRVPVEMLDARTALRRAARQNYWQSLW
jgi:hypothetical protein